MVTAGEGEDGMNRESSIDIHTTCALSHFSRVQLFVTPWTVACRAPLPMEFSRQEHWSGLPFSTPGNFPNPAIEPTSPVSPALAGEFFITVPPGKHWCLMLASNTIF